ncbi:MAG: AAA family ATPase [Kluyvera sp.]
MLTGLTSGQVSLSLSVALEEHGSLDEAALATLLKEKEQIIGKSGVLEMVKVRENLADIGGLENLKKWLERKAAILHRLTEAEQAGLQAPKGVLVAGMPGCGKSLTAKAVANLFQLPLLRLDIGSLLGKYVGESEHNMRRALAMAETISPCVLWVDELEKAFVGIGGSNTSEVTSRLLGYFLTWMQEKTEAVFVVATANNVTALPPELLRKGRFDDVFYVGFPYLAERKAILAIHLRTVWNTFSAEQQQLAVRCRNFAGADIQNAINEAREKAFLDGVSVDYSRVWQALENTVPLRETLRDQVSQYETLFEKMKLKAASRIDGLSLAQMISLADDTNPHERLKVAQDEECSEDLLEKLAKDSYLAVRKAVYQNPNCSTRILSACIAPAETGDQKDKDMLAVACVHHNAPENLLISLIQKGKLANDVLLELVAKPHCKADLLSCLMAQKNTVLQRSVLRHANCPVDICNEHLHHSQAVFRAALALNPSLNKEQQQVLVADKNKTVRIALAQNMALEEEIITTLKRDSDLSVVTALEETRRTANAETHSKPEEKNHEVDLLTQIKQGSVQKLLSLASRQYLPEQAQNYIATHITNEAVLVTLASNPTLHDQVQYILASEGSPDVRTALAVNPALSSELQKYLFDVGQTETKRALMSNIALSEEVQLIALECADYDIDYVLLRNPNISEDIQHRVMRFSFTRGLSKCFLAMNSALSEDILKLLSADAFIDSLFKYSGVYSESKYTLRSCILSNPNISKPLAAELMKNFDMLDYLEPDIIVGMLANPGFNEDDFKRVFTSSRGYYHFGLADSYYDILSALAKSHLLAEKKQAFLIDEFNDLIDDDNCKVIYALTKNAVIAPACQAILLHNGDANVVMNLLCNEGCTPRTKQSIIERIKVDSAFQSLFSITIDTREVELERRKEQFRDAGRLLSDDGMIVDIKTIVDVFDNDETDRLLTNIKLLKEVLEQAS